ncbi:ird5 [Drosophila busckii]|uniref:IkappaB kinase n=1 Tax=Drosophila busckii TaxID=30019 RepID=A0A0M3QYJ9_DROBS|nr:inhibitor of nuclear factor kappa-B kinase subunit beta [Drosophila busckii]ALC47749.1 ird5 [Drosophila busckii]
MAASSNTVGQWEFIRKLGQGGFGEVQHWRNLSTKQEIAAKVIKNGNNLSVDQQRKMKERWCQEHNFTLASKQMPSIVAGVKLGEESADFVKYLNSHHIWQLPVIILEYCNDGDVRNRLKRAENANGLAEYEVREILRALRQAVHFLHTQCGVCHRDLKPDNIVIQRLPNGRKLYKLTDFGLARNSPDKTMLQSVVGTRHYYAPEVINTGVYNNTVDYWSMGIIAYEIACGELPFIPHQTPFNIHVNLMKKNSNCIAITQDYKNENEESFTYHNEIPVVHHLSKPWQALFTKWLTIALDANYKQRGTRALIATDEVQAVSTAQSIFTGIDCLLDMKILTLYDACSCKRLEIELTPNMTMPQLGELIIKETGMTEIKDMYLVLPTGHPHKQLKPSTQPHDLYVDAWADTSEDAGNPPVMMYIFNAAAGAKYSVPNPVLTELLQYCIQSTSANHKAWLMERRMLDMHYLLSKEQTNLKTLLFGLKEYAMTLEHEMINFEPYISQINVENIKLLGAMEHFKMLTATAAQQQKFDMNNKGAWKSDWLKLELKHEETKTAIDKIIRHYQSALRSIRDTTISQSNELYNTMSQADKLRLLPFRKKYVQRGAVLPCEELRDNIVIDYAKARHAFYSDPYVEQLRENLNKSHCRFRIIPSALFNARQNLTAIQEQLLQLQLQMLPSPAEPQQPVMNQLNNAMGQLSFDAADGELSVLMSVQTESLVSEALRTMQTLQHDMEVDRAEQ